MHYHLDADIGGKGANLRSETEPGGNETILRDSLARDRTNLANERTLLAYVRTGLALGLTGVSLWHFLDGTFTSVLGGIAAGAGFLLVVFGGMRFEGMRKRILSEANPES